MRIRQSQIGFTVLEAMIAIFVVTVGATGVFALVVQSISVAASVKNQTTAWYLAQEGIEIVRNIRDTNFLGGGAWDSNLVACSAGCEIDYDDSPPFDALYSDEKLKIGGGFYNYDTGSEETLFKRKITITKPNPDLMEVQVEVFWDEHGNQNEVEVITKLYNWKEP